MIENHSVPHLGGFDFAYNGIDGEAVRTLVGGAFVKNGENLLIIGEAGTGKTAIARAIEDEAVAQGAKAEYLGATCGISAAYQLYNPGPGFVGYQHGDEAGLKQELLDCDLLVVDEADRWFTHAPVVFTFLLCKRIELGKTNILVITKSGWKRAGEADLLARRVNAMEDYLPSAVWRHALESRWTREFCQRISPFFAPQIRLVGLGVILDQSDPSVAPWLDRIRIPATAQAARLVNEYGFFPSAWARSREVMESIFEREPVWHVLCTGDKNYRSYYR